MRISKFLIVSFLAAGVSAGCYTAPQDQGERAELNDTAHASLDQLEDLDPSFKAFLDHADGYAVFPDVGKGGFIAGGAYGHGEVFEGGKLIGYSKLTQATVGAQIGGQSYIEVLAFERPWAMERFKEEQWSLSANASAVALTAGAAAVTRYTDGVAVFIAPQGGLMAEATVGGQNFSFEPQ
jgi:lipid-binding SYLF domain-containing protein